MHLKCVILSNSPYLLHGNIKGPCCICTTSKGMVKCYTWCQVSSICPWHVLHPSPPCSMPGRLTCMLCRLDSAWVGKWEAPCCSPSVDEGYLSPDPISAECRSAGATFIYPNSQLLRGHPLLWLKLSGDSGNHLFPLQLRTFRSPVIVSPVGFTLILPHITNSPLSTWA